MAYRHFEEKDSPGLPILVYMEAYSNNFAADGIVYEKIRHMQVDLYTASKEPETEDRVENALSGFFGKKTRSTCRMKGAAGSHTKWRYKNVESEI